MRVGKSNIEVFLMRCNVWVKLFQFLKLPKELTWKTIADMQEVFCSMLLV